METILKLSSHLTAWHDDVIRLVKRGKQQKLEAFTRGKKYQGPLNLLIALLGRSDKYMELSRRVTDFERAVIDYKILMHNAQSVTDAYNSVMNEIDTVANKL